MAAEPRAGSMQLITRAAAVLRALEGQQAGLSLGRIAQATALPRATVQRIVDALAAEGLAAIDAARGGVTLGPAVARMAASMHTDVVARLRPVLEALSAEARETAMLSLLRDGQAILLDQSVPDRDIRLTSRIGNLFPLATTADGKALVAGLPEAELRRLIGPRPPRPTGRSLADWPALLAELRQVQQQGYATDWEENMEGICALAAPLLAPGGERYALSLLVPAARFAPRLDALRLALLRHAEAARGRLG